MGVRRQGPQHMREKGRGAYGSKACMWIYECGVESGGHMWGEARRGEPQHCI